MSYYECNRDAKLQYQKEYNARNHDYYLNYQLYYYDTILKPIREAARKPRVVKEKSPPTPKPPKPKEPQPIPIGKRTQKRLEKELKNPKIEPFKDFILTPQGTYTLKW